MSVCRSCGAPVLWVLTETGKRMPLDLEPDPEGLFVVESGTAYAVGLFSDGPRYTSHFATCPDADEWRKREESSSSSPPPPPPPQSPPEDLASYPVDYPTNHVGPPDGLTIEESFWIFHRANPHVYDELVRLARQLRRRGVARLGIGMLYEVLRWRVALRTGGDEFKLSNNHRSYYARLIMLREDDLAGVFETRPLRATPPEV